MANTVSVDAKMLETVLKKIDALTKEVHEIKEKLSDQEPPYGSNAWWELSDKRGLEDIKKGNYREITSKKELQEHLDALKKS
jgi:hypothetical protein